MAQKGKSFAQWPRGRKKAEHESILLHEKGAIFLLAVTCLILFSFQAQIEKDLPGT